MNETLDEKWLRFQYLYYRDYCDAIKLLISRR